MHTFMLAFRPFQCWLLSLSVSLLLILQLLSLAAQTLIPRRVCVPTLSLLPHHLFLLHHPSTSLLERPEVAGSVQVHGVVDLGAHLVDHSGGQVALLALLS